MTVTTPVEQFENTLFGDGANVDFPFTFNALRSSTPGEFVVVVNITDAYTYIFGTEYTVDLNSDGTGTVHFVTPPDDGDEIHIYRLVLPFQLIRFIKEQDLSADVIEFCLDKLTILIQQLTTDIAFITTTTIPNLQQLFEDFVNGILAVLGPGAGLVTVGSIPVWSDDDPTTLASGLAPGAAGTIITSDGAGNWIVANVSALDINEVTVPPATDLNGLPYWDSADGSSLGTLPAGVNNELLAGVTGSPPDFKDLDDIIEAKYPGSSATDVFTSNGDGTFGFAPPAAAPANVDAFFINTSVPRGIKVWVLTNPGAYTIGGKAALAKTQGASDTITDDVGIYKKLTTTGANNSSVKAYTTKDDIAATRQAYPLWITRVVTGASVANVRYAIGFGSDNLVDVIGGVIDTSSALFVYDTSLGHTTWRCVVCDDDGNISAYVDTGVAVTANTRYVFAIDMQEDGHVKFLINAVEEVDAVANLPTVDAFLDWMVTCKALEAATKSIAIGPTNMTHG